MSVEIEGLDELNRKIKKLSDTFEIKNVKKAARKPAGIIQNKVKSKAPVGPTGDLRRSVITKELDNVWIAAIDQSVAWYAFLIEFGLGQMSENPFFSEGVKQAAPQASKEFKKNLKSLVDKAVR